MDLKGKIAVITGGTRGFGKALGDVMAQEGAEVVRASLASGEYAVDVTQEKSVQDLAARVVEKFGKIDVWINNAGIWVKPALVEEMSMKRVHDMIEVNLFGTIYGSKTALVQMKKQANGMIINIISSSGLEGRARLSGYVASKFASTGFTQSLRAEAKDFGISVVAVYPGGMKTEIFNEQVPEDYEKFMDPLAVARQVIDRVKKDVPDEEIIIRRK